MQQGGHIVDYNLKTELEHGIYVSRLARQLAAELNCSPAEQYLCAQSGLLHDIGKLTLAGSVPGHSFPEGSGEELIRDPLLIEEIQYVRSHSRLSCEILREAGYHDDILGIVYHHHENYDGTGYPDGLQGVEIPMGARILRVCDVFAALTSDRPYRKRFQPEDAMAMMIEEVNHFDMGVFLCFQRLVHRIAGTYHFHFEEDLTNAFDEITGEWNEGYSSGGDVDTGICPCAD